MRVVEVSQFGGPEVLTPAERPAPVPGPGQLLVDVAAAGVNYMDIYQREGRPPYASSEGPFIPGAEGAGTVTAAGRDVAGFAPGDRVAWTGIPASYAEQVVLPADRAVPVPDGMDLAAAAAVMLQGCTAHYLCHDTYPVQAGDPVVVHAAAGGVGLLLTQLVKLRGGIVIATVSTPAKAELARGALSVRIGGTYPLGEAVRAHEDLAARRTTGKLLLVP